MENDEAMNDLEKVIDLLCDLIPSHSLRDTCENVVRDIVDFIEKIPKLAFESHYSPRALCSMYNYCTLDCCISDKPEQVHISYTGTYQEMGVTWITRNKDAASLVYGTNATSLTKEVTGVTKTYTDGGWAGFVHHVTINGLEKDTQYFYRVGKGNLVSEVFSFRTEHPVSNSRPVRIAVIGDMGALKESDDTISRLEDMVAKKELDFIIHDGDISYADGFQELWDVFMRKVENIAANVPYMVTPGNHEIGVIGILNVTLGYNHRFTLPGEHSQSNDLENLYYSFDYGNIHFVALDSESTLDTALITDEQLAWFINDLEKVDRSKHPWVIVYFHRPLYCSNGGADCGFFAEYLRERLEHILIKYNVDLVIQGHKHDYERTWPVNSANPIKSYDNPKYPTYVVSGCGGNREGTTSFPSQRPDWSAVAIKDWGYGLITIGNNTHMDWKFYTSSNNELRDQFTLVVDD
eukprot:TRINITY_DN11571_c0_g1_i1.p1 TRINITY_DN11571_c0_g1~~TRINITY_DN11571_c0_g1_i1.p1  ORF type:complete len:511 (-),score=111.60 TRINITY_DN11571_c0_g1_i1:53-1444(-)